MFLQSKAAWFIFLFRRVQQKLYRKNAMELDIKIAEFQSTVTGFVLLFLRRYNIKNIRSGQQGGYGAGC